MKKYACLILVVIAAAGAYVGVRFRAQLLPLSEITDRVHAAFPGTTVSSVKAAPVDGLVEVVAGRNVFYVDAAGKHAVLGDIYDLTARKDVTAARRDAVDRIAWNSLPLDGAVKTVVGAGTRKVAVFSDPECPFCKRLHQRLGAMKDITVYEVMYPLEKLHPGARAKAISVLCAAHPADALQAVMIEGKTLPAPSKACQERAEDAIKKAATFGRHNGFRGTPVAIAADGRYTLRAAGMTPVQLDAWLNGEEK